MAGRPRSDNKMTVVATARLSDEQSKYVNEFAKAHNISFSTAIRAIIEMNKNNYLSTGGNK